MTGVLAASFVAPFPARFVDSSESAGDAFACGCGAYRGPSVEPSERTSCPPLVTSAFVPACALGAKLPVSVVSELYDTWSSTFRAQIRVNPG